MYHYSDMAVCSTLWEEHNDLYTSWHAAMIVYISLDIIQSIVADKHEIIASFYGLICAYHNVIVHVIFFIFEV